MNGRPLPPPHDSGPDPRLRAALDALPRERTPPPDKWEQIRGTLAMVPRDGAPAVRRRRTRMQWTALTAIAATLLIAFSALASRGIRRGSSDPLAGLSEDERRDPRVLALVAQTRNWHAAANDSLRSARWPAAARVAVDGAIESTNRALVTARAALARDPNDVTAREAIDALRDQQRAILQHAITLLDDI